MSSFRTSIIRRDSQSKRMLRRVRPLPRSHAICVLLALCWHSAGTAFNSPCCRHASTGTKQASPQQMGIAKQPNQSESIRFRPHSTSVQFLLSIRDEEKSHFVHLQDPLLPSTRINFLRSCLITTKDIIISPHFPDSLVFTSFSVLFPKGFSFQLLIWFLRRLIPVKASLTFP
jgi:hypothetical protein